MLEKREKELRLALKLGGGETLSLSTLETICSEARRHLSAT